MSASLVFAKRSPLRFAVRLRFQVELPRDFWSSGKDFARVLRGLLRKKAKADK